MKKKQLLGLVLVALGASAFFGGVSAADTYTLDEVTVYGDRTYADGIFTQTQSVGMLGKKDVMEVPFHVSSFSEKAINTLSAPTTGVTGALKMDPAVRVAGGLNSTSVSIRGFSTGGTTPSWYFNGIPGMAHQGQMPMNAISKVTVLAGPALGFNGTEATGGSQGVIGMVALESKKAEDKPVTDLQLAYGSDTLFYQSIDVGRRFGDNNRWGVRFNAMHGSGDAVLENSHERVKNFGLNIDQKTSHNRTNFYVGYDKTQELGGKYSFSLSSSIKSLPRVPKGDFDLAPKWAENQYDNWIVTLNHEQDLNEHVTAYINAGYHREDYMDWIQGSIRLDNLNGDYHYTYLGQYPVAYDNRYIGTGIKGKFKTGTVQHEYTLGIDKTWYSRQAINSSDFSGNNYPFSGNIYHPHSTSKPSIVDVKMSRAYKESYWGWHVVDNMTMLDGKLNILAGAHGHYSKRTLYGAQRFAIGSNTSGTTKSHAVMPTWGISYKFTPDFMLYADHTETFSEGTLVSSTYENGGSVIPPMKTKQNEVGVKYKKGNMLYQLDYFQIKQPNILTVDRGAAKDYYLADGERKHSGVELSVAGDISKKWSVAAAFSKLTQKQEKTQGGINDGILVDGAPEWSMAIAAMYRPNDDLSFMLRCNYTGDTGIRRSRNDNLDTLHISSYTTWDAGLTWNKDIGNVPVTWQLYGYNIFDHRYWYTGTGSSSIYYGMPRTIMLSATVHL